MPEHEPLSWLALERYVLDELTADERALVDARLAASADDRARLAEILNDHSELPALPSGQAATSVPSLGDARKRRRRRVWFAASASACAAAAALLLWARGASHPSDAYDGVKGSDVSLRLVSERQGALPQAFADGERFKVEVTCPPQLGPALRLLIFQGDERFEPLPRPPDFACGNLVAWPGAFALDGDAPADVCVYWGDAEAPARQELGDAAVCARLVPR